MIDFTYTEEGHEYRLRDGRLVPSITQLLKAAGYTNDWFTDEGRDRGTSVHQLCEDYDRGRMSAHDIETCRSDYQPYLASYVKARGIIDCVWTHVEQPMMAEDTRFAGRVDRVGFVHMLVAVGDLKTGHAMPSDPIQLALQAILVAPAVVMPAESIARFNWYLKANGKCAYVVERTDPCDFAKARRILREHGGAR